MSQTKQNWIRYLRLLKKKLPEFYSLLLPPKSDEVLDKVENLYAKYNFPFLQEYRDIWSITAGENLESDLRGAIGFDLRGFGGKIGWVYGDNIDDEFDEIIISVPQGYVKPLYINKKWLPFAYDGVGGSLCIDLDPDEKGKIGQIISFNSDDNNRVVFADSLADFFQFLGDKLENNDFLLDNENGDPPRLKFTNFNFSGKDWSSVGGMNIAMLYYGEVDEENDLLGKRKNNN